LQQKTQEFQEFMNTLHADMVQKCADNEQMVTQSWATTENLQGKLEADYAEFVKDRVRWKSDFVVATTKISNSQTTLEELVIKQST
jgi:hypothetical protein